MAEELLSGLAMGGGQTFLGAILSPFTNYIQQFMNSTFHNQWAQSQDVIEAYYRGIIDEDTFHKGMKDNDIAPKLADQLLEIYKQLLNPVDYISLYRRGFITQDQMNTYLGMMKYSDTEITNLFNASTFYPSAQDLVTWGVRQIYQPALRTALGQDMQYPKDLTAAAQKIGMSEEMIKNYWAAHWSMPSPDLVFRMYSYGLLDNFTLPSGTGYTITAKKGTREYGLGVMKQLLFVSDYLPAIIDEITGAMFNPLTRIDLRAMYEEGVLTKKDVYNGYLALGYNDTNAQHLTDLAVAKAMPNEKALSKTTILSLYDKQEFTRDQAIPLIENLGYSVDDAGYILDLEDWKNYDSYVTMKINTLKAQYLKGIIDDAALTNGLNALNLTSTRTDYEFELITNAKLQSVKKLTLAEYESLYKKSVISADEFKTALQSLNYSDMDYTFILRDMGLS